MAYQKSFEKIEYADRVTRSKQRVPIATWLRDCRAQIFHFIEFPGNSALIAGLSMVRMLRNSIDLQIRILE